MLFIRRFFIIKFVIIDFIGEVNWFGVNIDMWFNEINGVISCFGILVFRFLLSGYKNKIVKITSLFYKYLDILRKY